MEGNDLSISDGASVRQAHIDIDQNGEDLHAEHAINMEDVDDSDDDLNFDVLYMVTFVSPLMSLKVLSLIFFRFWDLSNNIQSW